MDQSIQSRGRAGGAGVVVTVWGAGARRISTRWVESGLYLHAQEPPRASHDCANIQDLHVGHWAIESPS